MRVCVLAVGVERFAVLTFFIEIKSSYPYAVLSFPFPTQCFFCVLSGLMTIKKLICKTKKAKIEIMMTKLFAPKYLQILSYNFFFWLNPPPSLLSIDSHFEFMAMEIKCDHRQSRVHLLGLRFRSFKHF